MPAEEWSDVEIFVQQPGRSARSGGYASYPPIGLGDVFQPGFVARRSEPPGQSSQAIHAHILTGREVTLLTAGQVLVETD